MLSVMDAGPRRPRARGITTLTGQRLDSVRLDHAIVLGFSGGCQVLIETVAHLRGAAVEPGEDTSDLVAELLGDTVRTVRTGPGGDLRICFVSGAELVVAADPDVESWAFTGPDGQLVVCLAHGEIAVWGDARA
ncbi:DUF6188 family protein [Actinoplanes sp. NPDC051494]|uniref:DUF6188 family protein n=1 Tax=Actinoplanes sp. NPDC051494 TaxID=3363907 RepID=UPI00378DD9C2